MIPTFEKHTYQITDQMKEDARRLVGLLASRQMGDNKAISGPEIIEQLDMRGASGKLRDPSYVRKLTTYLRDNGHLIICSGNGIKLATRKDKEAALLWLESLRQRAFRVGLSYMVARKAVQQKLGEVPAGQFPEDPMQEPA